MYIDPQFIGGCLLANVAWIALMLTAYVYTKRKSK